MRWQLPRIAFMLLAFAALAITPAVAQSPTKIKIRLDWKAGAQHAPGAADLDALIVSVGRPARVRDLRDTPAAGLERHRGRVDVAGLADGRLDEAAAMRRHLDHFFT